MVEKKDNIIKGFNTWAPRFIVAFRSKKSPECIDMNNYFVFDRPDDAYFLYDELKRKTISPMTVDFFEWILTDSFGKNAIAYCKQKAEGNSSDAQNF